MSKKKSLPAATDRGIRKISGKTDTATKGPGNQDFHSCPHCAFFRAIQLPSGYIRTLCQFTGEKRPYYAMPGCRFIRGAWENLDGILGLTGKRDEGKLEVPNHVRQRACLSILPKRGTKSARHTTEIHSIADKNGIGLNHIGKSRSSSIGDDWRLTWPGRLLGLPFFVPKTQPCEVQNVD